MRTSNRLLFVCLAISVASARAECAGVCVSAFEKAEREQAPVAESTAGRGVIGAGRLYFHVAPDKRCRLRNVFVVPGDRLDAYAAYGDFTSVIYWSSATGTGTAGRVMSSRLAEAAVAVASTAVWR